MDYTIAIGPITTGGLLHLGEVGQPPHCGASRYPSRKGIVPMIAASDKDDSYPVLARRLIDTHGSDIQKRFCAKCFGAGTSAALARWIAAEA